MNNYLTVRYPNVKIYSNLILLVTMGRVIYYFLLEREDRGWKSSYEKDI